MVLFGGFVHLVEFRGLGPGQYWERRSTGGKYYHPLSAGAKNFLSSGNGLFGRGENSQAGEGFAHRGNGGRYDKQMTAMQGLQSHPDKERGITGQGWNEATES